MSNDPSLVEMLEMVGEIKLTMYPDLPLPEALRKLHEQLKQCALKNMPADLTATAAVDDLKSKLSSIMFATEEDRGQNIHVQPKYFLKNFLSILVFTGCTCSLFLPCTCTY